jgi:predicted O-linked N-acetylglucosamine transferase (SPINDLY family)
MDRVALQQAINELLTLHGMGRFAEMEQRGRILLRSFPNVPLLHELVGMALGAQYRYAQALPFLTRAVRGNGADPQFWENLGLCQFQLKDLAAAETSLRRVLALRPGSVGALDALAAIMRADGRRHDAQAIADEIAAIDPDRPRRERAQREQRLRHAIAADPHNSDHLDELGLLLRLKGDVTQAQACLRRAIELDPRNPRARINLALLLSAERREQEALAVLRPALDVLGAVDASTLPETVDLFGLAAFVLDQAGQCGGAVAIYKTVHRIRGKAAPLLPMIRAARQACDWTFATALEREASGDGALELDIEQIGPGPLLYLAGATPMDQLAAATAFARSVQREMPPRQNAAAPAPAGARQSGRLRVSYFARDFNDHPSAMLLAGVIEAHDRGRFDIVAHDFTPPAGDDYRRRLEAAFDRMIPIGRLSDEAAAQRIAADEVDILIDVNGWTTGHRAAVLAGKPAPLQLQWLGYAGTMGAPWIDYIVADRVLIPPGNEPHFSEKIIRLPASYQPTDDKRSIGEPPARADTGLPDDAFVFCCFNAAFKITPDVFDVWMRLLDGVERSVLWLLEPSPAAAAALRSEAQARGLSERIILAPRLPSAAHLARLRHADLALDCRPYGSHTTASDMLWTGVPLVALMGDTFASRVSASVLTAGGLADLITSSLDDYHRLALRLATDRADLAALKARVAEARHSAPLFDTAGFTRKLEAAFTAIWERHQAGARPDHVSIP